MWWFVESTLLFWVQRRTLLRSLLATIRSPIVLAQRMRVEDPEDLAATGLLCLLWKLSHHHDNGFIVHRQIWGLHLPVAEITLNGL